MRCLVVMPVFNDWDSFRILLQSIDELAAGWDFDVAVLAIDDGSAGQPDLRPDARRLQHITAVDLLSLSCNLGHQRAITVGLAEAHRRRDADVVVVMDSDGEDRPEDIAALVAQHRRTPHAIIAACRRRRSEGLVFRLFYAAYKRLFTLLTGQSIDFGNFCLIPEAQLGRLLHMPELWNHLAGSTIKSRAEVLRLPTVRGLRYSGRSSMNLVSLVIHGLCAIAVFGDVAVTRMLLGGAAIALAALGAATVAVLLRLFTALALPGWTTTVVGLAAVILCQVLSLSVIAAFLILGNRTARTFIPAHHAQEFVLDRRRMATSCRTRPAPMLALS